MPGPRRERRFICGPHFGEPGLEALGAGLQVEDAVQLQEPFDRVGQRCPLLHQAPALPEQSLAVFLLNARYPHPAEHRRVAPVVRQQRAHHLPGVDPIRLALLRLSVHQKARRIEHDRLDRHRSVQPARQPEPLVARFVTAQNTHFTAERAFGLGLLMLDQILETYDVRCPKRVQADPLTRRALDPDDPTLPAYLDRDVQRVCSAPAGATMSLLGGISCLLLRIPGRRHRSAARRVAS